ncbi:TraC family protein [Candidatus Falkowbacteria bacterium]|nr:TraC family protein [Candidatus Falkowbacteria bacterium]
MRSDKLANKKIKQSTQIYLDVAEIKNDCAILRDGSLRAILLVSSVNFALKSDDEQTALVGAYVNFLNSIEFPLQVVVQSRKLDIDGYLRRLDSVKRGLTNELLKRQIIDYQAFIKEMVTLGDIMSKKFFVVISYSPVEDKKRGFFSRLGAVLTPGKVLRLDETRFEKDRHSLGQRVENVIMHLSSMGLTAIRLDTQSLIELYYNVYNPDISANQRMMGIEELKVEN